MTRVAGTLALVLALSASLAPRAQSAPQPPCPSFSAVQGGYRVSTAFAARHDVITPPKCLRPGDLLSVRPLRLNPDEYLVLQECRRSACRQAQVVRAWNSSGYMGPYPVLNDRIRIEAGERYLLWMQHVPMPGTDSFRLIKRYGPPLVFEPIGSLTAYPYAQRAIEAARERGPERITNTVAEGSAFVATFEGGSVVRMQALRARN
ncbi:MAG: hypothetical protein ACREV7_03365 [Steroidobacteraceae bacterium]